MKPATPKPPPAPRHVHIPLHKQVQVKAAKPALTPKEALAARTRAMAAAAQKPKAEAKRDATTATAELTKEQLEAGWDGAVAAVRAAGDAGPALVAAWSAENRVEPIVAVAEADDAPGAARKAARRAINVLKARGVAIPERPKVARIAADDAVVSVEATFIAPDPSGAVAISIASRDATGRYHVAEVIARDSVGILHAGTAWLSGSHLKEGRARALESLGVAPVPVPLDWARWRIAAAREQNAKSKQIVPLGFERCKELVEPVPASEPPHPVDDLDAAITSEAAWAKAPGSASLHEEPEFRAWVPDRQAIEEMLVKLGERLGPEGVKSPEAVNAGIAAEVESATDRYFSPEFRQVLAARMKDSAISVRARRGDDRATDVLATARAVREAGLITSPPHEVPFLKFFFQKAIAILLHQGNGSLRIPVPATSPSPPPEGAEAEAP